MPGPAHVDHQLVRRRARGRWRTARRTRARRRRCTSTPPPPRRREPPPGAPGSTCRAPASPLRARNERSAGSMPDRASWVGNSPRVRSRRASSAVLVAVTSSSSPVAACPAALASRALAMPVGHGGEVGQHVAGDGRLHRPSRRVVGLDDPRPRPGQVVRGPVELGDVRRELGLERDVAEDDGGLAGQRLEQSYVGRGAASPPGARPGCCRAPPSVADRHLVGVGVGPHVPHVRRHHGRTRRVQYGGRTLRRTPPGRRRRRRRAGASRDDGVSAIRWLKSDSAS